jgi:hypothetical protein
MKKKLAIVIGHRPNNKGAYSHYLEKHEYDFFKESLLDEGVHLIDGVQVFTHADVSYSKSQELMAQRTKGFDLVVECHFDMFNGKATGGFCKCNANNKATKLISEDIRSLFKEYGCYDDSVNERGEYFIKVQKPNAILIEFGFGDNESDSKKLANFDFCTFFEEVRALI